MVNFIPITVKNKEKLPAPSQLIDKANGYVFGSREDRSLRNLIGSALGGADFKWSKWTSEVHGRGWKWWTNRKVCNDFYNVAIGP